MRRVRNSTAIITTSVLVMLLGGVSALAVGNYVQAASIGMLGLTAILGQITVRRLDHTQ